MVQSIDETVVSLGDLLVRLGGELRQGPQGSADAESIFCGVGPLTHAGPQHISFLTNPRYLESAFGSRAGLVLCSAEDAEILLRPENNGMSRVVMVCPNPYAAFARVSQMFFRQDHGFEGRSAQSFVDMTAVVHESVTLFPFVFIGPGARVGPGCVLYPGSFVGAGSEIGEGAILYPNAVVREGCRLGKGCVLNPGAVVGGDGFGFAPDGLDNVKIPQVGGVVVGDYVELGSNASVDRGTIGDTVLANQTKIDSLVQIGHNVSIGKACFVAGISAIGGSTKIGDRVTIGGHVAVAGHLSLASGVTLLGACGVTKSLKEPGLYNGVPAVPNRDYLRREATLRRLVERERTQARQGGALVPMLPASNDQDVPG
jgi:UDP-3-O-[3-hydroxymyristoyl] glucosamine N-acyltransferase